MSKNTRKYSQIATRALLEKAQKDAAALARKYDAAVVWMGNNRYILIKDGVEVKI